jgi:hypothetical protein
VATKFSLPLFVVLIGLLGDEAYGVPISEAIAESSGREVALGSVYNLPGWQYHGRDGFVSDTRPDVSKSAP